VITKEQLKAWRDAAEKATAGPWFDDGECTGNGSVVMSEAIGLRVAHLPRTKNVVNQEADAEFIAISREAVPALVAEVERLRAVLRDFVANYDCDADAHRYNTNCRACVADAALGDS
jgi:hypothetical protein